MNLHENEKLQFVKDFHYFDYFEKSQHFVLEFSERSYDDDVVTEQSNLVFFVVLYELSVFVDLNRHCLLRSLKIVLHQLQNVRHDIDDVFNFDDQKSFARKLVENFVKVDDHTRIEAFIDKE